MKKLLITGLFGVLLSGCTDVSGAAAEAAKSACAAHNQELRIVKQRGSHYMAYCTNKIFVEGAIFKENTK